MSQFEIPGIRYGNETPTPNYFFELLSALTTTYQIAVARAMADGKQNEASYFRGKLDATEDAKRHYIELVIQGIK